VILRVLADAVVFMHFGFVLFVGFGGFLVLGWPRVAWAHVPATMWGVVVELGDLTCPLTPLENWLRAHGDQGCADGFVEHYLAAVLYPAALTRDEQLALGVLVLVVNVLIYSQVIRRRRPV